MSDSAPTGPGAISSAVPIVMVATPAILVVLTAVASLTHTTYWPGLVRRHTIGHTVGSYGAGIGA